MQSPMDFCDFLHIFTRFRIDKFIDCFKLSFRWERGALEWSRHGLLRGPRKKAKAVKVLRGMHTTNSI